MQAGLRVPESKKKIKSFKVEDKITSSLSSFSYITSGIQLKIDMPEEKKDQITKTKKKTVETDSKMIHIKY